MRIIFIGSNHSSARLYNEGPTDSTDLTWAQSKGIIENQTFEMREERTEEDGSKLPQFGLCTAYNLLITTNDQASTLKAKLQANGADIVEYNIKTQFGEYTGFRAFNYLLQAPQASIFRLEESPKDSSISVRQFVTPDFSRWLKDNFDCRGIVFREAQTDGRYKPRARILPAATNL